MKEKIPLPSLPKKVEKFDILRQLFFRQKSLESISESCFCIKSNIRQFAVPPTNWHKSSNTRYEHQLGISWPFSSPHSISIYFKLIHPYTLWLEQLEKSLFSLGSIVDIIWEYESWSLWHMLKDDWILCNNRLTWAESVSTGTGSDMKHSVWRNWIRLRPSFV